LEELVDRVLAGEASAEERESLERMSASDPKIREVVESRARLFSDLRRLRVAEPPPEIRGIILETVKRETAQAGSEPELAEHGRARAAVPRERAKFPSGHWARLTHPEQWRSHMANKKWILGAGVILVAVVAAIALRNPGPKSNTQGTIGAANRYHSEQVTGADVSLDNPQIASFIQSDTFRKLAASPAFREAAKSDAFNRVVASDALREASAKHDLSSVLENAHVVELLKSDAFAKGMTDAQVRESLLKTDLAHLIESGRLTEVLKSDAFKDAALRTEFVKVASAHLVEALRVDGFRSVMEGLNIDTFAAVREVASSAMVDLFRDGAFREAAARTEFSRVADAGLVEALAKVPE
jgi:hypothetical protein